MVNPISHSINNFCHIALLDPYCEAIARINRAIEGVNLHHIQYPRLGFWERVVDLLLGAALLLPLVNVVVLICMRTFGSSEPLSKNLVPSEREEWQEAIEDSKIEITPEIHLAAIHPDVKPIETSEAHFMAQENGHTPFLSITAVETHADRHIIKTTAIGKEITSILDRDWKIKSMHWDDPNYYTKVTIRKGLNNTITIRGDKHGHPINLTHSLDNPTIPWIQNPHGYKPFLASNKTKIVHYSVFPQNLKVYQFKTTKDPNPQDLPGHPQTTKLVTTFNIIGGDYLPLLTAWYDKDTHDLIKTDFNIAGFVSGSSTLIPAPPTATG